MIEAVFISDLHLHPDDKEIQARFDRFLDWAKTSVKTVYILGDFFHAWAGDDELNDWSLGIAKQLNSLAASDISLYYLHGNRDFLLGDVFAQQAGWSVLREPTIISLGKENILLAHGDRYCIKDKKHQGFRLLTRNKLFTFLFLNVPLSYRQRLVHKVRTLSQNNQKRSSEQMDVVDEAVIKHLSEFGVNTLIHGHTHRPGLTNHDKIIKRYVLSDWDDNPQLLCYDNTKGLYFAHY